MKLYKDFIYINITLYVILFLLFNGTIYLFAKNNSSPPLYISPEGKLIYTPDEKGNRIPDFSYCGYMASEQPIPDVPIRIVVPNKECDATQLIQSAIDYIASLPLDQNGFRGTILLEKGEYKISGRLKISASGIVLRGSGMGENGTTIIAGGIDRKTLIRIYGINDRVMDNEILIKDVYVPVNAINIKVGKDHNFKTGDKVIIHRPSTEKWIELMGMDYFGGETGWLGWKPETRDIYWDRQIKSVKGEIITLDVPITTALDTSFGGGYIYKYEWPGRIYNIGIENIRLISEYDNNNLKDENHCWMAITFENIINGWVRQVTFENFAGSAVAIYETAKQITVEDCISLNPVSEIGGQRRYTFFTSGQQTLFQRCYAEYGYHDFAVGFCTAGPNAFVQCESYMPYSFSGAIDSWASGVLFDIVNIDGNALCFSNRIQEAHGAGWCAANSMFWQCSASKIECFQPPFAQNWAFGTWGEFSGDGYWYEANSHIEPRSLYYTQLAERLGINFTEKSYLLQVSTQATSSPTIEQAAVFTEQSVYPPVQLSEWIEKASERQPINTNAKGIKTVKQINITEIDKNQKKLSIKIENGWLVDNNGILTGDRHNIQWWRGNLHPDGIEKARPHLTRYVPGRLGNGFTDDLEEVINWMVENNIVGIEHNYGLWYDRRRDDHVRTRRMNGEVWTPFYELPFARTGQGIAWDGLSKYDLTKYNPWYWNRLKEFADLAGQKGLILIHQNYFQHNILEAGAHWADFPWRTANNINDTGFPEPPSYAGDKRIFMAEQFYDISDTVRRELHKLYIRKCLDNFIDNENVIQLTGAEYTGPLDFVEFWIDVIMEWERETGKNAIIGLSATKDVQDSILNDPVRSKAVEIIDIRYWHYCEDGSLYAPKGGQNLAPRQHARLLNPGNNNFNSIYKAVREYNAKYPDKAVIYSLNEEKSNEWAVFMAGGSLANIPEIEEPDFLKNAFTMHPYVLTANPENQCGLVNNDKEYIIFSRNSKSIKLDLSGSANKYQICWIDPENGQTIKNEEEIIGGKIIEFKTLQLESIILWIKLIE